MGLKQALELASGMGQRKARNRREALCVRFINISGETVRIPEPALVIISLFINKWAA